VSRDQGPALGPWEVFLRALLVFFLLVTLPALSPRLAFDRPTPVALVADELALRELAQRSALELSAALSRLRALGTTGVAFYEEELKTRAERGRGRYLEGGLLSLLAPEAGFLPGWWYAAVPGAERIPAPQHRVFWQGERWIGFEQDVGRVPLGPPGELSLAYRMGFWIAYRPENHPLHPWPPEIPPQSGVIVFVGEEVLGWPDRVAELAERLAAPVALIEGTPQAGIRLLAERVGAMRLFSLQAEYQMKLAPETAAGKYALAARERGHQILYFRPYPTWEKTERFLKALTKRLEAAGIPVGEPAVKRFSPHPLALAAWGGVAAGLLLYLSRLPLALALPTGLVLVLLAFGYGKDQAGPLLVGLVFPVLGLLEPLRGLFRWLAALGYTLAGAVFLTALGSRWETLIGLEAFRGVGLLLVLPPLLFLLAQLPKQGWQDALARLYEHRVKLGELGLGLGLAGALALAFLRRGNQAPFVLAAELALRAHLEALMIRPRFKELVGHAALVFALLAERSLPPWVFKLLLAFGVVAEASILDSFAHYHTPFLVSVARTLNGILFGGILGLLGWAVYLGVRRWWWR